MRAFIFIVSIHLLFSCNNVNMVDKVIIEYIISIEESNKRNFNVFVLEIDEGEKSIIRINAGSLNLDRNNIPYNYYKYNNHYVFKFNPNRKSDLKMIEELEELNLFIEREDRLEENNGEWILVLCKNNKNKLFKAGKYWYRPLDEIEEINNFKCN